MRAPSLVAWLALPTVTPLRILDASKVQHKIRLAAIDAPEKSQAFGNKSKQALSKLCFDKQAIIKVVDTDRYGRTVGEVICAGTNVNEAMVRSGMAWV
jgi:endonuclease YncB( thermonuclease family)